MHTYSHQILSTNIKRLRAERGWSQERLAEETGLHRTYIGAVERLERNPTLTTLHRIAHAFNLEVWQLLAPSKK